MSLGQRRQTRVRSPNLSLPQGCLNGATAGSDLAKDIGIVNGRSSGDSLPHELHAEEVDDAGDCTRSASR